MGKEFFVVALGEISALVRAARFGAMQRTLHDCFGDVEHEPKLHRGGQFGVECKPAVIEHRIRMALLELAQFCHGFLKRSARSVDSRAFLDRPLHFVANRGYALAALFLFKQVLSEPPVLIHSLRENRSARHPLLRGKLSGRAPGARTEDQEFRQGI